MLKQRRLPSRGSTAGEVPPITKITSLNGDYDPNHAAEIYVHPGDMITLTADLLDPNNGFQAMGDSVEDFVWSSGSNECDAADDGDCLLHSNFQTTDYGVTYYVPYTLGEFFNLRLEPQRERDRSEWKRKRGQDRSA